MGSAPFAIPAALGVLGALYIFGRWHLSRTEQRPVPQAISAREGHPAGRKIAVPGLQVDGEPLDDQEWADYVGCLFASNQAIPDVHYGGTHG